jgi:hypothetical protein
MPKHGSAARYTAAGSLFTNDGGYRLASINANATMATSAAIDHHDTVATLFIANLRRWSSATTGPNRAARRPKWLDAWGKWPQTAV